MENYLEDLLRKICEESYVKSLGITPDSGIDYIERICEYEKGEAIPISVKKFSGDKYKVLIKRNEDVEGIWKALKSMIKIKERCVNWKFVKRNYDLTYERRKLEKGVLLTDLGIEAGSVVNFQRKLKSKSKACKFKRQKCNN